MTALSTVVFADLSGSTSLFEALGNEAAAEAVTHLTQWIAEAVQGHGGRVVKLLGDGVLGVFDEAGPALDAMAAMQRTHRQRQARWPLPVRMDFRVGVASGEVIQVEGDCYGDAVNVASRLCERAGPSEILLSEAAMMLAAGATDASLRRMGMMELRGKAEPLTVYLLEWRDDEEPDSATMQAGLLSQFTPVDSVLGEIQFSWHGVDYRFTSAEVPVHIGRATDAELCINDPRVSRLHGRIDWRSSSFVLTDLSSFGTWVLFEGGDTPVRLRRDTCILHGSGRIALGVPFTQASAPVLHFQVSGTVMHLG